MTPFDKVLFLPINLPTPGDIDFDFLDGIDLSEMFKDEYRNCYHINLLTSKFEKTRWFNELPSLSTWLGKVVLPKFMGRVMIIVTPPETKNHTHIDCSPEKFNTLQHKFRFVLRGRVQDLRFVFFNGKEISPPKINNPFIMDGSWPHYMENTLPARKYTLAIGYPWEPNLKDKAYSQLLQSSYEKYSNFSIFCSDGLKLPENWNELFENKYLGGCTPEWHKRV